MQSGALAAGTRLPSTRVVAQDLAADPRVVAAAYRVLEAEGLVELRPRSGVYVSSSVGASSRRAPAAAWVTETLSAAVLHGVSLRDAAKQLRVLGSTEALKVVVAASIADQVDGLVRELETDFGITARGVIIDSVSRIDRWPRAVERADLVITTPVHAQRLRRFHRGATRPLVIAGVRQDLMSAEWRLLASGICFVIVADPRFASVVREFLRAAPSADGVAIRVAGRDHLGDIAPDAPTYITEAARRVIGRTRLPGRLIPPARILDEASTRSIVEFIVSKNEKRQ